MKYPFRSLFCLLSLIPTACYTGIDTDDWADSNTQAADAGESDGDGRRPEEAFPGVSGTPAIMYLATEEGTVELNYLHLDNGYGVFEGDIILYGPDDGLMPGGGDSTLPAYARGESQARQGYFDPRMVTSRPQEGAALAQFGRRWPNRTVLWQMSKTVTDADLKADIIQAVADIDAAVDPSITNFVEYKANVHGTGADRVLVLQVAKGCASEGIGRMGTIQHIEVSPDCELPSIIHEFGHAMGLWHEHNRDDRDEHITIFPQRAIKEYELVAFSKIEAEKTATYDINSIMHYGSCFFSRCRTKKGTDRCYDDKDKTVECTFSDRYSSTCDHCECEDPKDASKCLYPIILGPENDQFQGKEKLSPTDVQALESLFGCPGKSGDYCGGLVGLSANVLYTCKNGIYTVKQDCGSGTCLVAPQDKNDSCTTQTVCPSGDNGWYCGQAFDLPKPDHLYWCVGGEFKTKDPAPHDCGVFGCVVAAAGHDDYCLIQEDGSISTDPGDECTTGPCCDNGLFSPDGTICANDVGLQYGCPWGIGSGADVGVQYRDQTCTGSSATCDGPHTPWEDWQIQDDCAIGEYCDPGDATCNNTPPVMDCAGGVCCDPNGFFLPQGQVCSDNAEAEYNCPWGTNLGDDVGVRYRDQLCSGLSASCDGPFDVWEAWQVQDVCSTSEVCQPADPACNACAASYWDPSSASDIEWDSQAAAQLELEKEEVSGDVVRIRICKVGDTFDNDIHLDYEEWEKYGGLLMYSDALVTVGANCSSWINLDTSAWNEGENLGADVRVVSPSWCQGMWDGQCNINPGCGNCWYWSSDTAMQRTCLQ